MGSSGGGERGSYTGMSGYEKGIARNQQALLQEQAASARQMRDLAGRSDVQALGQGGLTPAEQMQLDMVEQGRVGMTQDVRDQASSRGLFSSAGAITQEGLIPMQLAQQRANIYGQAQQRQFQGLGLQQGLLGSAGQGFGAAGAGYGNLFNQSFAGAQYRDKSAAGAQQGMMGNISGAANLGMGIVKSFF